METDCAPDLDRDELNERIPGSCYFNVFVCPNCGKEVDGWNEVCEECIMET